MAFFPTLDLEIEVLNCEGPEFLWAVAIAQCLEVMSGVARVRSGMINAKYVKVVVYCMPDDNMASDELLHLTVNIGKGSGSVARKHFLCHAGKLRPVIRDRFSGLDEGVVHDISVRIDYTHVRKNRVQSPLARANHLAIKSKEVRNTCVVAEGRRGFGRLEASRALTHERKHSSIYHRFTILAIAGTG
eukprot:CAMPEP_0206056140 /NCGR_PEP_ID=MMETSP1466-20131121/41552_1 /ASSEMBLY_ACC=CAM_ASM_001126 /TAXON_ID=44452 /ORGANISM="Pavlova gyrans, Strain CCMP608" /LENGTH=187 /DNA_ID=CAMNT_0053431373 /DNA_START=43 /DNA_END=603 /DNA_ORIENTATION=-